MRKPIQRANTQNIQNVFRTAMIKNTHYRDSTHNQSQVEIISLIKLNQRIDSILQQR